MHKMITFLGTGIYSEVSYCWNEREYKARFFPVAVANWLQPDCIVVMLTEQAEVHSNWSDCRPELEAMSEVKTVRIPNGKSEDELWQIFNTLTEQVEEGDTIILDITHGFRSLPLIGFLVLAYLRQAKNANIKHLLYGAFDARDENGVTPVFDLTPFMELLDWLGAVKMFLTTGMGHELAEMLKTTQNRAWKERRGEPRELKSLGIALEEVSDALLLSRVPLLGNALRHFQEQLTKARPEIEQWAFPLAPLLERIESEYAPYANADHTQQVALIEWYLNRGHIVQAVTLMREWVISEQVTQDGGDPYNGQVRKQAEEKLNQSLHNEIAHTELLPLWREVVYLRNDIAHCGFGRQADQVLQPNDIRKQAHKLLEKIKARHLNP